MATVQRLTRQSPSEDELELVRSKALARLAALSDRDRRHGNEAGTDDATTGTDTTALDEGNDVIDAQDGANGTGRTATDGRPDGDAAVDGPRRPPVIVLGGPGATNGSVASDATPTSSADDEAEPTAQVALFPAPDADRGATGETGDTKEAGDDVVATDTSDAPAADAVEAVQAEVIGEEEAMTQVDAPETGSASTTSTSADSLVRDPVPVMAEVSSRPAAIAALPAYCPYCATYLDPAPTEDSRCARCKQHFVLRQVDGRTVLLVEAAVPVFEAERQRLLDEAQWARERGHWLTLALMSGAPRDRIAKAADEPPTKAKITAARTLYLATVDKAFETAARAGRWDDAAQIRYAEALVLFDAAGAPIPRPPADLPKAPSSERKGGTSD